MVDFHSHVLPFIDDGAKDLETSAEMLLRSGSQGVEVVVATPHFYPDKMTADEFLKKREDSVRALKEYIETNKLSVPVLKAGAEVRFAHELLSDNPERLKIEGTNTILVELPFTFWNDWIYNDLFELSVKYKLNVVIAHLERYIEDVRAFKYIEKLFDLNVYIQVNADSFLDKSKKKIIKHLIKKYRIDLIGTDMHNLEARTTNMDKALKVINKKYGEKFLYKVIRNSKELLGI